MKKLVVLSSILLSAKVFAVDVDTGDYVSAPEGTNLALLYLQHASSERFGVDANHSVVKDEISSVIGIARFVHYLNFNGVKIAPQILVPFGKIDLETNGNHVAKTSGVGDITLAMPFWLIENKNGYHWAITPYLSFPTGNYEQHKILNMGEDRYKFTLQSGISKKISNTADFDFVADFTYYENTHFNNNKLKQDLGYQVQASIKKQIRENYDLRAGLSYLYGGDKDYQDHIENSLEQTKIWLGSSVKISNSTQMLFTYGQDLDVSNGFKEKNRFNFRILHAF